MFYALQGLCTSSSSVSLGLIVTAESYSLLYSFPLWIFFSLWGGGVCCLKWHCCLTHENWQYSVSHFSKNHVHRLENIYSKEWLKAHFGLSGVKLYYGHLYPFTLDKKSQTPTNIRSCHQYLLAPASTVMEMLHPSGHTSFCPFSSTIPYTSWNKAHWRVNTWRLDAETGCSLMKYVICCFLLFPVFRRVCDVERDTPWTEMQTRQRSQSSIFYGFNPFKKNLHIQNHFSVKMGLERFLVSSFVVNFIAILYKHTRYNDYYSLSHIFRSTA